VEQSTLVYPFWNLDKEEYSGAWCTLTDLFPLPFLTRLRNHHCLGQYVECHDIGLVYLSCQEYTWEENKFELWKA
jgi:hypothetical protein